MAPWLSRHHPGIKEWFQSIRETTRWSIVFLLFFPFCALEVIFGRVGHSSSLIIDALHTATDSASILAMVALAFIRRTVGMVATAEKVAKVVITWSLALFIIPVIWGAIDRIRHPELANGVMVISVAAIGACANLAQHWVRETAPAHEHDYHHHASMSHIIADLWLNVLVVVGGTVTLLSGIALIDPLVSLLIVPILLVQLYRLFRPSSHSHGDGHVHH